MSFKSLGGILSAIFSVIGYDHSIHRLITLPEHVGQVALEAKISEESQYNLIEKEHKAPLTKELDSKEIEDTNTKVVSIITPYVSMWQTPSIGGSNQTLSTPQVSHSRVF